MVPATLANKKADISFQVVNLPSNRSFSFLELECTTDEIQRPINTKYKVFYNPTWNRCSLCSNSKANWRSVKWQYCVWKITSVTQIILQFFTSCVSNKIFEPNLKISEMELDGTWPWSSQTNLRTLSVLTYKFIRKYNAQYMLKTKDISQVSSSRMSECLWPRFDIFLFVA